MIISRRTLLASLGLALPLAAAGAGTAAASRPTKPHHVGSKHAHLAHARHHGKPHAVASARHPHTHHA